MVEIAQSSDDDHVILINSNMSFESQNFHGFHELVHIPTVDTQGMVLKCFEKILPTQDPYIEWLANEGAAEFLVPYQILLPLIRNEVKDMMQGIGTYEFCLRHSADFLVTPIVIEHRIDSLRYEIYQYLKGIPLDEIELLSKTQQEKLGIKVKSLVEIENERLTDMLESVNISKE